MTTTLKSRFVAGALVLGCALPGALAQHPATPAAPQVDEAIGRPSADPYAFYVFNRQDPAEPKLQPLPPVVCICFDDLPNSTGCRTVEAVAQPRPR
jgi:hypothetical protein